MMKKIIIFCLLVSAMGGIASYSVCKIDKLDNCKADIGPGINDRIQNKMIPDNLNQIKMPSNSFSNRNILEQPKIPEDMNTNTSSDKPKNSTYDANCQFGNCLNSPQKNNFRN